MEETLITPADLEGCDWSPDHESYVDQDVILDVRDVLWIFHGRGARVFLVAEELQETLGRRQPSRASLHKE